MLVSWAAERASERATVCVRACVCAPLSLSPPHSDSLAQLFHLDLTAVADGGGGSAGRRRRRPLERERKRERHSRLDRLPE